MIHRVSQVVSSKKKSLSLRWKWAILLSLSLLLVYAAVSFALVSFLKQQHLESEKKAVTSYADSVTTVISYSSSGISGSEMERIFSNNVSQQSPQEAMVAYNVYNTKVSVRVLDSQNRVVYESQPLPAVDFRPTSEQVLSQVNQDYRAAFVTTQPIFSPGESELMGYLQLVFDLEGYYEQVAAIDQTYFWISLVALLLCTLVGNLLAYYFFKPIKHMTEIMADFKEDTSSKKRMDFSKRPNDELTDLSVGFNDLLDTMALYINQQKQFVEDVSHELRTPVAIVEGHLQLLNRWGKTDPEVLDESLSASLSEIGRMKLLVQEMLDLSRAEQVGILYKNEMTEVNSLVSQIYQNFQLIYPDFQFHFDNDLEKNDEEIWVNMSRNHLEQVLIILLDNAVKYSTNIQQIHVSLSKTVNNVYISVQDFGEGISESDLPKVFGRFYRVDKARSRHKGGNGLGLSIAKELIEGYKGDISVASVVRQGSTFRIALPVVLDPAKVAQAKRHLKQQNMDKI